MVEQEATDTLEPLNLDESTVGRLLSMEEVIAAMERALADFSSGTVVQPVRTMLPLAEHQGFLGLMPAYTGSALGAKLVAFYPRNTAVPTHHATILLFRPETGEPIVSMDGRLITEVRTAAVSAVATDRLAKADASVLALIGSGSAGAQPPGGLEARTAVRGGARLEPTPRRRLRSAVRRHSCNVFGRGGGARRRRGGDRDDVEDARTLGRVALAGSTHQCDRWSRSMARARRRGSAPLSGLRGLSGGRYEGIG